MSEQGSPILATIQCGELDSSNVEHTPQKVRSDNTKLESPFQIDDSCSQHSGLLGFPFFTHLLSLNILFYKLTLDSEKASRESYGDSVRNYPKLGAAYSVVVTNF